MSTFLDYLALFLICLSVTAIFYLFIYIHELPHKAAERRGHPHAEAIGVACWLSLFTLHALWPIVFIWSLMKQRPEGSDLSAEGDLTNKLAVMEGRLAEIEKHNSSGSKRST